MPALSPLRYPGGKTRGVQQILSLIPPTERRVISPFVGGASVEIALAQRGVRVYGFDNFKPLVLFWRAALNQRARDDMLIWVQKFYEDRVNWNAFNRWRAELREMKAIDTRLAALFFTINRASFSGMIFQGGHGKAMDRFTPSAIARLAGFSVPNLTIGFREYREQRHVPLWRDKFIFADPPYMNGARIYGYRGESNNDFNHDFLAHHLHQRKRWVLCYNDCERVRALYHDCTFTPAKWAYGMNASKKSNEVLITPC